MPRGGARNRSGPQKQENSGRSDRAGFSLTALPSEGYGGEVPAFPLPKVTDREVELWTWAWGTPQACAWSREPWRWHTVAMWVRTSAVCESFEATAADKNSLHRFADQIGLTPAGLKENGWKIAGDEVSAKRSDRPKVTRNSVKSRLAVVADGGA